MAEAKLVAQQARGMVDETRQGRARWIELVRTSQETIERSKALIKRIDAMLAATENPKG